MKTAEAEVLAAALSPEQRAALQIVKGKEFAAPEAIQPEPLVVLSELGLIRREAIPGEVERELLKLTQRGRKVAEFV